MISGRADNYFKSITVVFVCLAAFLCAKLASELIAIYLWAPIGAPLKVEGQRAPTPRPEALADYLIVQGRNLFNDNPPAPGSPAAGKPSGPAAETAPPPPAIDFTLVATGAGTRSSSFALFTKGDQTLLKRVGMDVSPGIALLEVYKDKVVVGIGKEKKDILLFSDKQAVDGRRGPARPQALPSQPPSPASTGSDTIKQIGPNSWAIDRKEIDQALGSIDQLITQLRVSPHEVDGQVQGFRVFNIRPGSLFTKIGVLDGDIIKSINDTQLTGIDMVIKAKESLMNQTSLQVSLIRNSQPMTISYEIR